MKHKETEQVWSVRIPNEIANAIRQIAEEENRSLNKQVVTILQEYLKLREYRLLLSRTEK